MRRKAHCLAHDAQFDPRHIEPTAALVVPSRKDPFPVCAKDSPVTSKRWGPAPQL
jgi:hypothetical protein